MINVTTMRVTPQIAAAWLVANLTNRKIQAARVAKMARDMDKGAWAFIGDPIRLTEPDESGLEWLIDGQHRMNAIVESGTTQQFVVITGLPREAQAVVDSGKGRSISDTLHMAKHTRAPQLAAAARLLWLIGNGAQSWHDTKMTATNTEIVGLLASNPAIEAAMIAVDGIHAASRLRYPAATIMWYFGVVREPGMTEKFFESLRTGAGLQEGDPVLALRNRLNSDRRLSTNKQLYLGLRAMNLTRSGQPLMRSSLPRGQHIDGAILIREVRNLTTERVAQVALDATDDE